MTPNNFLLGYKSFNLNIGDGLQTDQIDYINIANIYWNRWLRVYTRLKPHLKWAQQTKNFKIGDSVIIKLKYVPRNHWPLAQVI